MANSRTDKRMTVCGEGWNTRSKLTATMAIHNLATISKLRESAANAESSLVHQGAATQPTTTIF